MAGRPKAAGLLTDLKAHGLLKKIFFFICPPSISPPSLSAHRPSSSSHPATIYFSLAFMPQPLSTPGTPPLAPEQLDPPRPGYFDPIRLRHSFARDFGEATFFRFTGPRALMSFKEIYSHEEQ